MVQPARAMAAASAALPTPLSATRGKCPGNKFAIVNKRSGTTCSVCKSRLFTPSSSPVCVWRRATSAFITAMSASSKASSKIHRPSSAATSSISSNTAAGSMRTMSSAPPAPAARASYNWYGATRKSLRMAGTPSGFSTATARRKCSRLPSKRSGSVSTETAAAPPRAYPATRCSSASSCCSVPSCPSAGERSLSSAMRSKRPSSRSGGAGARAKAAARTSASGTAASAAA